MALTVVGEGTWLAGNNTALTPTIPSGGQTGDTVVCIGYVRENGATLGISGTWTERTTHASPANEMRASVWTAPWVSGMSNPTVTPSGSGSNDTTLATCILLRGTISGVTVITSTTSSDTSGTMWGQTQMDAGDAMLMAVFVPAAATAGTLYAKSYTGAIPNLTESNTPRLFWTENINSALGSDSSGLWGFFYAPTTVDGTTDYYGMQTIYTASGNQIRIAIKFDSTPPPPVTDKVVDIDLVLGSFGTIAIPAVFNHAATIDFLFGWGGVVEKQETRTHDLKIDFLFGGSISTPVIDPYFPTYLYGIAPAWDATGDPNLNLRDWTIGVAIDGISIPATSVTIRRTLGVVSLSVSAAGFIVPAVNALLSVNVAFRDSGVVHSIDGYVTESTYAKPTSVIIASKADQQSYGVAWNPPRKTYRSNSRIRTEVDWYVMPGDLVEGATINDVVTVLGGKSWMTEVGYG